MLTQVTVFPINYLLPFFNVLKRNYLPLNRTMPVNVTYRWKNNYLPYTLMRNLSFKLNCSIN